MRRGAQLPVAVAIQISDGGAGRTSYGVRDPGHRADGDSRMVKRFQKSERGVALLAVLLGVALMTLVVVDFALTSGLGFVSAANQANELRATTRRAPQSMSGSRFWPDERTEMLAPASTTDGPPAETLSDTWAQPFPPMPLEGGNVSVSIVDEARKININSMFSNGAPQSARESKVERLFTILDVTPA